MADKTSIEWTDATWNPITGCSVVSPGCTNCYAMRLAGTRMRHQPSRAGLTRDSKAGPVWNGQVRFNDQWLDQPLRWARPRRIFVCAHGDLFHESVPFGWVMRVFQVMISAPQHTFQVLTKRADRMRDFFTRWADTTGEDFIPKMVRGPEAVRATHPSPRGQLFADMLDAMGTPPPGAAYPTFDWMNGMITWPNTFPNIWLGVSAEDQTRADERIPHLLATPSAVRWVSAEPLLGPVDLTKKAWRDCHIEEYGGAGSELVPLIRGIDWVITGGESGARARPMHPDWVRSLRDQCAAAGTAFLFKQWGQWGLEDPARRTISHEVANDGTLYKSSELAYPDGARRGEAIRARHDLARLHMVYPVGKKAAGRLLDGVEHNGMPGAAP